MIRLVLSLLFFLGLALAVGFLVSGDDYFDWPVAGGLFAIAVLGEGLRWWIRRRPAKNSARQSSGI
ncbi:hypothetical protein HPO96_14800 [Kribbella sandramycini]|uniref:Uncharacterized protein n=1 Tax=Kribbella sandramycini TaxID=60450 RepID=A0A7Y4KZH0_9ACTN|nr:hypothetical protein [Kribbella sandramycini]MBB6565244.1 hypothetical protein [Kribbella sandramycini]NOL41513.1 hypothetical protein [Kribbella sandramycini]